MSFDDRKENEILNEISLGNFDETPPRNFSDVSLGFSINLSAPGKVILFGEHSVVYGKPALAASLGLRTHLSLTEHSDVDSNKIVLNFEAVKLYHCYEIEVVKQELLSDVETKCTLEKPELINHQKVLSKVENFIRKRGGNVPLQKPQHQALVAFFYLYVSMLNNVEVSPFTITVKSDLDVGSGLGSSASYLVVLSGAFYEYVKHKTKKLSVEDINELSFRNLEFNRKKFSRPDLELISKWAFNAEKIIHGTPSGLDNTICTYGTMVEYRKTSPLIPLGLKHKLSVILVNSKIPKDTKAQVMKVALLKERHLKIIDHILNAMEEVTFKALSLLKSLDETVESRDSIEKCFTKISDIYADLGDCADINQNLLRSLGVSHSKLDEICAILAEKNLHGKLTGAGGGGYAFAFVPDDYSRNDLSIVLEVLEKKGYESKVVELGGPGIMYSS